MGDPMTRLASKVALITGGAAGIGLETARTFLANGARVASVDLREDDLAAAAADPGRGDDVLRIAADVSDATNNAR